MRDDDRYLQVGWQGWRAIETSVEKQSAFVSDVYFLARTVQAAVVRVRMTNGRTFIVKLSSNEEAIHREAELFHGFVQYLPVRTPTVVAHGTAHGDIFFILYSDDVLGPITYARHRILDAVRMLADVHAVRPQAALFPSKVEPVSHTPYIRSVVGDVRAVWDETVGDLSLDTDTLMIMGVSLREIDRLRTIAKRMVSGLDHLGDRMEAWGSVLSHGDFHLGNLMWSSRSRSVFIIDWEFAHLDLPFFDLFQLIDATSPTTPLIRPVSRKQVLMTYLRARWPDLPTRSVRRFLRDYARFACTYLFYILKLVLSDAKTGRFPASQMRRQLQETVHGLKANGNMLVK